jgi:dTDP-glucose 4,6-dehydratase
VRLDNRSTVLVTGGAGFIGSNFVNFLLRKREWRVIVFDKLTYAGSPLNLKRAASNPNYSFIRGDVTDRYDVETAIEGAEPDAIVHFAAETHVDRSIDGPRHFLEANVVGTFELLDAAWRYWSRRRAAPRRDFRFIHVSTDEVYGSLGAEGKFTEESSYAPNSPYAASKASADHFVRAYHETFALPTIITNCSNNYGYYQYPEKLIPLTIVNAIEGKPIPIYGTGRNVRDWLFVEDHCAALLSVLEGAQVGAKYNIGGNCELTNIEVVDSVCSALEALIPARRNRALASRGYTSYLQLKTLVADRPGHDRRYAMDCRRLMDQLGWTPTTEFDDGIQRTVSWYLANRDWCRLVQRKQLYQERAEDGKVTSATNGWNWHRFGSRTQPDDSE